MPRPWRSSRPRTVFAISSWWTPSPISRLGRPRALGIGCIALTIPNPEPPVYPFGDNVQAVQRVNLVQAANGALTTRWCGRHIGCIERGKMIDGDYYPYSPTWPVRRNHARFWTMPMAAVAAATAPRQWQGGHLKAVTEGTIRKMKSEGLIVEEKRSTNRSQFRRTISERPRADHELSRTVVGHRSDGSDRCHWSHWQSMVVNWSIRVQLIDQLPMAVVVVNCPPL